MTTETKFCKDCFFLKGYFCQHKDALYTRSDYLVTGEVGQRLAEYTRSDEAMCGASAKWFQPLIVITSVKARADMTPEERAEWDAECDEEMRDEAARDRDAQEAAADAEYDRRRDERLMGEKP